jgi:hypothetical protein
VVVRSSVEVFDTTAASTVDDKRAAGGACERWRRREQPHVVRDGRSSRASQ